MKIIVGLGNPGKEFLNTRHNVGFMVVNRLAEKLTSELKTFKLNKKFKSEVWQTADFLLVKPQTFMNDSGLAVAKILRFYKASPADLYLVHDDLDIKLGEYKLQQGKGPRQHKGILSVENSLALKEFWRMRVGVENRGQDYDDYDVAGQDYVLAKFSLAEKKILDQVLNKVVSQLLS